MTRSNVALLVLLACFASLPLFGGAYALRLGTMACMYSILALSWNIVGGFAGYPSFATAAFFGFGAYLAGILAKYGVIKEPVLALLVSGVGLGAARYVEGVRSSNTRDLMAYLRRLEADADPTGPTETLDPEGRARETAVLMLRRTRVGITTPTGRKRAPTMPT